MNLEDSNSNKDLDNLVTEDMRSYLLSSENLELGRNMVLTTVKPTEWDVHCRYLLNFARHGMTDGIYPMLGQTYYRKIIENEAPTFE